MDEPHEEVRKEEARAGETPHIARYVLVISTALLAIAFVVMLVLFS